MNKILVICGATATGKTKLAVDCALKLNSEVISADSQLIYRQLNIGTAKPTVAEMRGVKHNLIDIVNPNETFSVSDYKNNALPIIDRLLNDGKVPIVCGGTGFYINSILYNLSYGETEADYGVREKYNKICEEKGREYLFELLKKVDSESASTLHVNDIKRVIRALEIYEISGKKKSDLHDEQKAQYDYLAIAIDYKREELYDRIDKRVDEMFDRGLVDEVKSLYSIGIDENCQSMQAIGYKEVLKCLKNGDNDSTMRDIIKKNTRHYAKRQITFFKRYKNLVWLKPEDATAETILRLFNGQ